MAWLSGYGYRASIPCSPQTVTNRPFFLGATTSDLTPSATWNKYLEPNTEALGTLEFTAGKGATTTTYAMTRASTPNNAAWGTGAFTVLVYVTANTTSVYLSVRAERIDSSGTLQEYSDYSTETGVLDSALYTISVPSKAWTSGAAGDRLRFRFDWRNSSGTKDRTVTIRTGSAKDAMVTTFWSVSAAQTNYQKQIAIIKGSGSNSAGTIYLNDHALNWPNDVRFTTSDGSTLLDFYREESDTTDGTWHVELDSIGASGDTTLYIYYGKSSDSDASSGTNTFIHFSNLESNDFTEWTSAGSCWSIDTSVYQEGSKSAKGLYGSVIADRSLYKTVSNLKSHRVHFQCRAIDTNTYYVFSSTLSNDYRSDALIMSGGYFKDYSDGSTANLLPTSKSVSNNTWYRVEMGIDMLYCRTRYIYVKDGDAGDLITYYTSNTPVHYGLSWVDARVITNSNSGSQVNIDQYWVANYAYPEPAWATPGAEEAASAETYSGRGIGRGILRGVFS